MLEKQDNFMLRKYSLVLIIILAFLFLSVGQAFSISWQMSSSGIKDSYIRCIAFDKNNPLVGYAGSNRAIYKTEDGGKYWKEVLSIRGDNTKVNFILIDPLDTKAAYAATQSGLYRNNNTDNNWQRVFKGKNSFQDNCLCVAVNKEKIFLGTQEGLFVSRDNARTWVKTDGEFDKLEVSSIALEDNLIYVATSQGVFKSENAGESFTKVYAIMRLEDDSDAEEAVDEEDHNGEYYSASLIHQVVLDNANANKIYLATDKGVIVSEDGARSWKNLPSIGLASSIINALYLQDNKLFAATDDGVFELVGQRWNQIYQGLVTNVINFISADFKGNLWLATSNGVYKMELKATAPNPDKDIMITKQVIDNFKDEPSVRQIQSQAIKYAEADPNKIRNWRRQASLKALMPDLTLDFDKTVISSTSGFATIGPQDWAVNLQWNLGELIWNDDQTSIDSRSKLMVELRDSILDEVTRLYFERRRLQIEFLVAPAVDTSQRIEKELRLAELTASIDALTGGYLSKMLEQK